MLILKHLQVNITCFLIGVLRLPGVANSGSPTAAVDIVAEVLKQKSGSWELPQSIGFPATNNTAEPGESQVHFYSSTE